MSNYSQLLKDPRWQKKRLEIMSRDNFTCVGCRAQDKTLHVHHHYYISGLMPWEYRDDQLVTLCEECHKEEESLKDSDDFVLKTFLSAGLLRTDIQKLANLFYEKGLPSNPWHFRLLFARFIRKFQYRALKRLKDAPKTTIKLSDLLKTNPNG